MAPCVELDPYARRGEGLFEPSPGLRPLRVMIDSHVRDKHDHGTETKSSVLVGLLSHEHIRTWRYRDDGTVDDVVAPEPGQPPWVVATELDDQESASHSLRWIDDDYIVNGSIRGNIVRVARDDTGSSEYADLPAEAAADRRAADATAVGTARAIDADLLITERPYATGGLLRSEGVTVCTPAEALPIVGLYLRSQGKFRIYGNPSGRFGLSMNRGLFYQVAAWDMLTSSWRWTMACSQHDLFGLGAVAGSVFNRFARALRVRDDLLRAVNRPQNNDVAEDVLLALDTCLLMLMGAFDSSARVAHAACGLDRSPRNAGWQRERWWSRLNDANPTLAAIVRPGSTSNCQGSDGFALLTILGLRNTIHAAGLNTISVSEPHTPQQTLVGIPTADQDGIVAAMDQLGGKEAWGVSEALPGEVHADPAQLLDQLLPRAARLLNDLMDATPVEQLSGVTLTPELTGRRIQPVEAYDSTSSVNNSEGFFQL